MLSGTPQGFRDILPKEALARERICDAVRSCFASHGYLPVETPLLEDRHTLEEAGRIKNLPFQLFDAEDDELLVLRPDLTLPIARMAAARFAAGQLPARLRYVAPVVRERASLKGQPRQFTQLGVELIGGDDVKAESEVVSLLGEVLQALHVPAWKIVCGSVSPLKALLQTCAPDEAFAKQALALVHESDLVSLDELVAASSLAPEAARALHELPRLNGGAETIDALDELLDGACVPQEGRGTSELRALVASLSDLAQAGELAFDFSIINSFDYYTGIIFKAYSEGIAASLASGGRYDAVLKNLGMPDTCACGFALSLERLQEVLGEMGDTGVVTPGVRLAERPIRIAVPKGSLFGDTVKLLEKAGLPVEGLKDPGRRLIVHEDGVDYVIVRAQDAPYFVGYGGADCGICGNDSILEAQVELLQLVDLRYGACRFVVAEPRSAAGKTDRAYAWRGYERVATKYPHITQAYYDRIGRQVEILPLHGNIELGPIVGMADRIVDITATGTTLRENDLEIVDDVLECSARFFAGPAAYRSDARIRSLADRLAAAASKEE